MSLRSFVAENTNVKTIKYDKTHENIYILKIPDKNTYPLQVLVCETVYHQKDVMVNGLDIQHIRYTQ
jgi:hypothetical protein